MPKITFIDASGTRRTVESPVGWSVMEAAVRNAVPGIDADCGGACACATCHVQVDPAWRAKLLPKQEMEEAMLDFAIDVTANSRLACQLMVTDDLDGLVVTTSDSQH
jgi:ferredoxin, 2Fe-2S